MIPESWDFSTVAFRLYDLRHTGYIEREEVRTVSPFFCCGMDISINMLEWSLIFFCSGITSFAFNLQLKEMVLALLHESDLILSEDFVETIVDKVQHSTFTCKLSSARYFKHSETGCWINRHLGKPIRKMMDGLIRKSGRTLCWRILLW